jgi:Protein of unknown function (DUF3423).
MPRAINISDELAKEAQSYSAVYNRSMAKQIEYWSRIGKIAEENTDLTFEDIKGILLSLEEKKLGLVEEYKFDS